MIYDNLYQKYILVVIVHYIKNVSIIFHKIKIMLYELKIYRIIFKMIFNYLL